MSFAQWVTDEAGIAREDVEHLHLEAAFELLLCRCETARDHGAPHPLQTITPKAAGGNSRQLTRRMLSQLGYETRELRVVHRLMAGSTGGWEGLVRLYAEQRPLTAAQRKYARRQVRLLFPAPDQGTVSSRRDDSAGCATRASTP